MAAESERVFDLLPFFYDYYSSVTTSGQTVWPDGRGRYEQPRRLQRAFEVLFEEYVNCHKKPDEK
jgi:hypothetical protein